LTNWPVAWRLFAVIVLAVLMGLVFGGLQVASAVSQAHRFAQTTKLARLGQQSIALAQALENERAQTAMDLAKNDGSGVNLPADLAQWYGSAADGSQGITGAAAAQFMTLAASIDGSYPAATQTAVATAEQQVIATLTATRSTAGSTGTAAPDGAQLLPIGDYSLVIALLFQVNDAIGQNSPDTVLTTDVRSMGALSRAKDQASQQRAILWAALNSYALHPGAYAAGGGKMNAKALQAIGPAFQALSTSMTQEAGFLGSYEGSATPAQQNELQSTAF
jgi:hypothetical protein